MNDTALVDLRTGEITEFDPLAAKTRDAKYDAVIEYCRRVQDWPLLEQAVDAKIEDQSEFVDWWGDNVSVRQGIRTDIVADPRLSLSIEDIAEKTGISKQQVSKWRRSLKDRKTYAAKLYGAAYSKAMSDVTNSRAVVLTGEFEWYTPPEYVEAARRVMGGIDLDPASSAFANEIVKAARFYSAHDDGLRQQWAGRVFLNPPYKYPLVEQFVEKLLTSNEVTAAVLLTNNATDTSWWHLAATSARAICFTRGRISFYQQDGQKNSPTHGQTFFYFGDDVDAFSGEFGEFGLVK